MLPLMRWKSIDAHALRLGQKSIQIISIFHLKCYYISTIEFHVEYCFLLTTTINEYYEPMFW